MARDEHRMPVPGDESPLPWSEMYGVVEDCDGFEICQAGENSSFIAHAANYHHRLAEIVRRLAFSKLSQESELWNLQMDAASLWVEMQQDAKGVRDE